MRETRLRLPRGELERLARAFPFPDPRDAEPSGLVAYGGDLAPERLLAAYAQGIFPWYEAEPILWFSPDPRMLLRPGELVLNRSLRKTLRRGRFAVRFDTAFERVIRACAEIPRPGQAGTWITADMVEAYCRLHALGFAHSAESWRDGRLVGGVYGVSLGAAFFGESMFALESDASKVALATLLRQVGAWGFHFLDCQIASPHMTRLGARACSRARFLRALEGALAEPTRRGAWRLDPGLEVCCPSRSGGRGARGSDA